MVENLGQKYSEASSIGLSSRKETEIFQWFLVSVLFGVPIQESSAIKTFKCFQTYEALMPRKIEETGWDVLVKILDEGGYAHYDYKTVDKLLEVRKNLIEEYDGSLTTIRERSSDMRFREETERSWEWNRRRSCRYIP